MLNLQEITKTKKLYEIKMPDGTELTLKMPTQAMFQKIMELQDIGKDKPLEALYICSYSKGSNASFA